MSVNLLSKLVLISLFGVKWSNYAMSVVCGPALRLLCKVLVIIIAAIQGAVMVVAKV